MFQSKPTYHQFSGKKLLSLVALSMLYVIAFSAMGGGDKKNNTKSILGNFKPIKTTNGFTLKAGLGYKGSLILSSDKIKNTVSYNSIVTYHQGNSTYILPYKYNLSAANSKANNLQLVNLKFRMHR